MITEKDIRDIPKKILNTIKRIDKKLYPKPNGHHRFYSYLTTYRKELVKVTVAVRHRYNEWIYKQVAVHGIHSKDCLVKDIEYCWIYGFIVGWYAEGLTKEPKWYESDHWIVAYDKYYNPYSYLVNPKYVLKTKKYKYSALERYKYDYTLKYLRLYEKYPEAEYLVKMGLDNYATSKTLLRKIHKDKRFRQFIIQNRQTLTSRPYYVNTIFKAFKTNKSLEHIQRFEEEYKSFINTRYNYYRIIKETIKPEEYERFFKYIDEQDTSYSSYSDYLTACNYLGLDMSLDKNKYPHNFKRWHDIRIDEYHSKQAEENEKKKKELYKQFEQVANKYLSLQRNLKDKYITLIAKSPAELVNEGDKLHHCVGRMGYDQKFAREETLIFFIRNKDDKNTPLVTVEYSLDKHKVLQCYADHDSKPCEEIQDYVYKTWLPYANRKIRQIRV